MLWLNMCIRRRTVRTLHSSEHIFVNSTLTNSVIGLQDNTIPLLWSIFDLIITSDKGGGKCVCPCLSVCLSVSKNAWMDLDEMLCVDRYWDMDELINF